jgi:hypothetical protein
MSTLSVRSMPSQGPEPAIHKKASVLEADLPKIPSRTLVGEERSVWRPSSFYLSATRSNRPDWFIWFNPILATSRRHRLLFEESKAADDLLGFVETDRESADIEVPIVEREYHWPPLVDREGLIPW